MSNPDHMLTQYTESAPCRSETPVSGRSGERGYVPESAATTGANASITGSKATK
jgi:hypothetical protein